jgi:hypothetical protein
LYFFGTWQIRSLPNAGEKTTQQKENSNCINLRCTIFIWVISSTDKAVVMLFKSISLL